MVNRDYTVTDITSDIFSTNITNNACVEKNPDIFIE